jgi:polyhydroxybutyrate depolymerase
MTACPRLAWVIALGMGIFGASTSCRNSHPAAPSGSVDSAGTAQTSSLQFGGLNRTYTAYLPQGYRAGSPMPILLAFHGAGGDGASMRGLGLESWADRVGFIVVYPDAVGGDARHTWALGCFQCTWADVQGIDDYGFVRALLATLGQKYSVNHSRVLVTGVSLGGSLAFDFACRSGGLVAGAAVVASLPSPDELSGCTAGPSTTVLIMNGDHDPNIPWDGGGRYNYLSNAEAAKFWADRDHCPSAPTSSSLPGVVISTYSGCDNGTYVRSYRVLGGGHAWPAGDLDASKEISQLFFGH